MTFITVCENLMLL